jgi:hypothetical protein
MAKPSLPPRFRAAILSPKDELLMDKKGTAEVPCFLTARTFKTASGVAHCEYELNSVKPVVA